MKMFFFIIITYSIEIIYILFVVKLPMVFSLLNIKIVTSGINLLTT